MLSTEKNKRNQGLAKNQAITNGQEREADTSAHKTEPPLRKRPKLNERKVGPEPREPATAARLQQTPGATVAVHPLIPPAVWACSRDDIETLKLLIAQGVDLEDTGGRFNPPIHQALQNFNIEIVQLLLAHGASLESENVGGYTVIDSINLKLKRYKGEVLDRMLEIIEAEAARRKSMGL